MAYDVLRCNCLGNDGGDSAEEGEAKGDSAKPKEVCLPQITISFIDQEFPCSLTHADIV